MNNILFLIVFCIVSLNSAPLFAEQKQTPPIHFEGKVSCLLTRHILMPFTGVFTEIKIHPGQLVQRDEYVAQYELEKSSAIQLGRDMLFNELDDIRRYLEIEKQKIRRLERKESELQQLTTENLSPQLMLEATQTELKLTRTYVSILEKRSTFAKNFSNKTLSEIRNALGNETIVPGQIPEYVRLKAPITGMVLSLFPGLRVNALLPEGTVIATIGTMDTMLIRSLVYEKDILQLQIGDQVHFFPDSIPDKSFTATISSIHWTPASYNPNEPSYYQVEMTVPNPDLLLRDGFKGRIEYTPQTSLR